MNEISQISYEIVTFSARNFVCYIDESRDDRRPLRSTIVLEKDREKFNLFLEQQFNGKAMVIGQIPWEFDVYFAFLGNKVNERIKHWFQILLTQTVRISREANLYSK